jgi:hypothetical protein
VVKDNRRESRATPDSGEENIKRISREIFERVLKFGKACSARNFSAV